MATAIDAYTIEWNNESQCYDLVDATTGAWVDSDPSLDAVLLMAREYAEMAD
jgi:hypothetical protein